MASRVHFSAFAKQHFNPKAIDQMNLHQLLLCHKKYIEQREQVVNAIERINEAREQIGQKKRGKRVPVNNNVDDEEEQPKRKRGRPRKFNNHNNNNNNILLDRPTVGGKRPVERIRKATDFEDKRRKKKLLDDLEEAIHFAGNVAKVNLLKDLGINYEEGRPTHDILFDFLNEQKLKRVNKFVKDYKYRTNKVAREVETTTTATKRRNWKYDVGIRVISTEFQDFLATSSSDSDFHSPAT